MSIDLRELRPVGNEEPDFIRPLGCGEHFFNLYAQLAPVHFCLCVEIGGPVSPDALRSALSRVRERHPVLRASILADRSSGAAFYASDRPITLDTISVREEADWRPAVERELTKPMPVGATALMRAVALHAPDTTTIILTFHHAVTDGLSGVAVLRDLMRALAGERLEPLPFPPVIEEKILGWSSPHVREQDRARPAPPAVPIACEYLKPNIATAELSREETARLRAQCKASGTTMYGAIAAAAARHLPVPEDGIVRMVCPMDLRGNTGIDDATCGVFIGPHTVEVAADQDGPIWPHAAQIVQQIAWARSAEAVRASIGRLAGRFPPTAENEILRAYFSAGPHSSLVLSNLGVLPIAEQYGPHTVRAVWGPAMLTNPPADRQTIGVSTFGGRLRFVHQSYHPIKGLLPAIRNRLLAACA
jgi:hypothetical protein